MKKTLLMLLIALLLPIHASALDLGAIFGPDEGEGAGAQADKPKGKSKFLIHFKSGGSLEADNYTIGKTHVVVMMPSGALYFDKDMVESVEEVVGIEEENIQTIEIQPAPAAPKPAEKQAITGRKKEVPMPVVPPEDIEPADDNGHTEAWWKRRVTKIKEERDEAEKRYNQAQDEWNRYNGLLNQSLLQKGATVEGGAISDGEKVVIGSEFSNYDVTRYQDLRGSARVEMDRAKAEMDEADRMLKKVLPEEARKAGAPPGWLR